MDIVSGPVSVEAGALSTIALSMDVRGARYSGDRRVLRDVRLEVRTGEIVGICGHVGAGKTTLALAAAGLLERNTQARVDGRIAHPLGGLPPAAFVFSDPWTQLTELGGTVEEEVAVGPENQAMPAADIRTRVDLGLSLSGALTLAARAPNELSGGELQRVALASALALDTPLLVLDEPTAQLDQAGTEALVRAIRALADAGKGILLVEQNLDVLTQAATRLIVLADGALLSAGEPKELLSRWPPLDPRLGVLSSADRRPPMRVPRLPAGEPVLRVEGLSAGYGGLEVLSDISLAVHHGSATAWLGENGAGKSTLARAIMGIVPYKARHVSCGGVSFHNLTVEARARFAGLVFQDPRRQLFSRRVIDEATFAPRALGMSAAAARVSAEEALDAVGLGSQHGIHPGDLAIQAQRLLTIAAALAARPALLILDEPTAGQDAQGRHHIERAIDVQRERGGAALITHDLAFARVVCDDAVTIRNGRAEAVSSELPQSS